MATVDTSDKDRQDYFPRHITHTVTKLSKPRSYSDTEAETFLIRVNRNIIVFRKNPVNRDTYKNHEAHFNYVLKGSAMFPERLKVEGKWKRAYKCLRRPLVGIGEGRKNMDKNLAFRFNHVFLVKKFFTFGLRKTVPGTCHVYQTHNSPLLFYSPTITVTDPVRSFVPEDERHYSCYVLEPYSFYLVPENATYLTMAVDMTLFAVDVVRRSGVCSDYRNPLETPLSMYRTNFPCLRDDWNMQGIRLGLATVKRPHGRCRECLVINPLFVMVEGSTSQNAMQDVSGASTDQQETDEDHNNSSE